MPTNVVAALIGVLSMVVLLTWETIGLDGAADLLAGGQALPSPGMVILGELYQFVRDWQVLIAIGLLLWFAQRWFPATVRSPLPAEPRPLAVDPLLDVSHERQERGSALRRLDAALRQLEFTTEALKLDIRNSVQDSFMAFQVRNFLALPSPGLDSLHRDIGVLEPEVIYLYYRLLSKLEAVRAVNIENTGKSIIAMIEEVEAIMHHLRTAFQNAAAGELLPWPSAVTPRAAEPRRRARQETT